MKIGIDARCLVDGQGSGVGTYTRGLLRALFRVDSENSYVLFSNAWTGGSDALTEFAHENVSIRSFRIPNKLFHSSQVVLRRPYIDEMIGGVDLMFLPNLHFTSLSPRVPVVATFFDVSYMSHRDMLSLRSRLWHGLVNPGRIARRANAILTLSEHSKKEIIAQFGVQHETVHVVYPGFDAPQAQPKSLDSAEKYIVVLSDLEPRKNIDSIFDAFRKASSDLPERVRCIVIGRDGWNASHVRHLRKIVASDPRIELKGYVSEEEKWTLLAGAEALVYVSYEEGFGFPPLEAMSVGTPVLASSLASLPEVLDDAALFVNPYDVNEISEGLREMLTDDDLRARLVERGYDRARQFSWDASARNVLALFHHLHS